MTYDGIALKQLDTQADGIRFRKQFNISEHAFTVCLVGLLISWKGQEMFLNSAKLLVEKIPELKMIIVGGTPDDCTPYEKQLKMQVKQDGLENSVVFSGHVSDMPIVYNGLDIVVSASTSPEPLGTVVIESMAMGRPLIGPNHGGAAEMMEHEKTGLLFEPGNPESLATMIERFYLDKQWRYKLAQNARQHALETFDIERHTREVCDVYELVL